MRKKGFATSVFAALVVLALAFLASSLAVRNSGFQNSQLESRLVFERFEDAVGFANQTQEDAIVDSAFDFACGNAADFCADYKSKVQAYWNNAAGVLNDSIVNVSFSPDYGCSGANPFTAVFSRSLNTSSENALKSGGVSFSKQVSIVTATDALTGKTSVDVRIAETGTHFAYSCP